MTKIEGYANIGVQKYKHLSPLETLSSHGMKHLSKIMKLNQ